MSKFLKKAYKNFVSYTPGEQRNDGDYIKLNTNESPYAPAPGVLDALTLADMEALRLYPDPTGKALKEKLAQLYDVAPENIFLSNGSDDILNFAFMAFVDDDEAIAFPEITYSFYPVIARLHGVNVKKIPMAATSSLADEVNVPNDKLFIDYKDFCGLGQNIVIPNPNAPTGTALSPAQIEEIVRTNPGNLVLIDEAYVDFGAESVIPLTKKYDNLLVSRTFSKYASFAGGRLGVAIGDAALIQDLTSIQYATNPYNVNRLSMKLAEAIVDNDDYYQANAAKIRATRERVTGELQAMGFEVLPSLANFVFVRTDAIEGGALYEELKRRFILVRHFDDPAISDYNRISIGSDEQMDALIKELKDILK